MKNKPIPIRAEHTLMPLKNVVQIDSTPKKHKEKGKK